jgi:glycosyltransferase involved in cell wall biosynthesis
LRGALASLLELRTGGVPCEIVVVDNGSTDDTPAVARAAGEHAAPREGVCVRYVYEAGRGMGLVRNRGVRESRGPWIAFFDDDQLADPAWLAELLAAARRHNCRCVGGAVHLRLPDDCRRRLAGTCRMLLSESNCPTPTRYTKRSSPGTGNLLVHRDVFDQIGPFDESILARGEDTELFFRMHAAKIDAWYAPAAVVHHVIGFDRLSDEYLLNLAGRMGSGLATLERRTLGSVAFPFRWLARLAHFALVGGPVSAAARLARDSETALGARCRAAIGRAYVREGWGILTGRRRQAPAAGKGEPPGGASERRSVQLAAASGREGTPST